MKLNKNMMISIVCIVMTIVIAICTYITSEPGCLWALIIVCSLLLDGTTNNNDYNEGE